MCNTGDELNGEGIGDPKGNFQLPLDHSRCPGKKKNSKSTIKKVTTF